MSLLSSIFGGNQKKGDGDDVDASNNSPINNTEANNSTHRLFDDSNSATVVPSPQLYTYPTRRELARKKKEKANSNDNNNHHPTVDPSEQERLIQKKRKKSSSENHADDADVNVEDNNNNNNSVEDRTIFVGNLPLDTTRKSLAKLFRAASCGPIESTRIRSVPVVGVKLPPSKAGNQNLVKKVCANTDKVDKSSRHKSTVQGYVVFQSVESVPKALQLNNMIIPDGGGGVSNRRIRVDHAKTNYDARRSVFVGNLPYNADESTLQEHFAQTCQLEITDIQGVRIVRDKETYAAKGFGYVLFRDRAMVAAALQHVPETVYMERPLRVMVCGRRFKGKSGTNDHGEKESSPRKKARTNDPSSVGALKRILAKQQQQQQQQNGDSHKKRRARAIKKSGGKKMARKPGVSKRAVAESKVDKRVRKIQKRIRRGMGKARR